MSSVSNGLYFVTLPLVSVMRVIYTSKGMSKKVWGARYTLGARYISVFIKIKYFGVPFLIVHPLDIFQQYFFVHDHVVLHNY
jgi:hypothetical protein